VDEDALGGQSIASVTLEGVLAFANRCLYEQGTGQ
jgi:hypothetical protein